MPSNHKIDLKKLKLQINRLQKLFNETDDTMIAFSALCALILILNAQADLVKEHILPEYQKAICQEDSE